MGDILFQAEQAGKQLSRGRHWWEQGFAVSQGWSRSLAHIPGAPNAADVWEMEAQHLKISTVVCPGGPGSRQGIQEKGGGVSGQRIIKIKGGSANQLQKAASVSLHSGSHGLLEESGCRQVLREKLPQGES